MSKSMQDYITYDPSMSIDDVNKSLKIGLMNWLGIEVVEILSDGLTATMPVNDHTMRPGGILHGGSNLVLAETLAGLGSILFIDNQRYDPRGISVSSNHVGTATSGEVRAVARLIHKGRTTHLWDIEIFREDGKLISTSRVTNMIVEK
ncbi:MAG: PaaI family thioesterase [Mangrovibacterium sp.]